jgi:hypothetical protein
MRESNNASLVIASSQQKSAHAIEKIRRFRNEAWCVVVSLRVDELDGTSNQNCGGENLHREFKQRIGDRKENAASGLSVE